MDAEEAARDEVWGDYRFVVLADVTQPDRLATIDLGAGHSSGSESLCGRVITALKSQALLNESVGAGYLERHWPPALKEDGAWPLASLRQSFLNGSLTRLVDPDTVLRSKILDFVARGEFGLASGKRADGGYLRVWFSETIGSEEVAFESDVYLLLKAKAEALRAPAQPEPAPEPEQEDDLEPGPVPGDQPAAFTTLRIQGDVPPELWNRLGTKLLPKLRSGQDLKVGIVCELTVDCNAAKPLAGELRQILQDLGIADRVRVEEA